MALGISLFGRQVRFSAGQPQGVFASLLLQYDRGLLAKLTDGFAACPRRASTNIFNATSGHQNEKSQPTAPRLWIACPSWILGHHANASRSTVTRGGSGRPMGARAQRHPRHGAQRLASEKEVPRRCVELCYATTYIVLVCTDRHRRPSSSTSSSWLLSPGLLVDENQTGPARVRPGPQCDSVLNHHRICKDRIVERAEVAVGSRQGSAD